MKLDPDWEYVADTVMGGVSTGQATAVDVDGRHAMRLQGDVSLDNNGGFVQMAFDLSEDGVFDASAYDGIWLELKGNGERYDLRLRTDELTRPWHSFRTEVIAFEPWATIRIPFASFEAHRTDVVFNPARLRRVGILGIGREFHADVFVSQIGFFTDET